MAGTAFFSFFPLLNISMQFTLQTLGGSVPSHRLAGTNFCLPLLGMPLQFILPTLGGSVPSQCPSCRNFPARHCRKRWSQVSSASPHRARCKVARADSGEINSCRPTLVDSPEAQVSQRALLQVESASHLHSGGVMDGMMDDGAGPPARVSHREPSPG